MTKPSLLAGLAALAIAVVLAPAAEAHLYGAAGAGFAHGFVHPLSGIDHLLAMVAVGLWAGQNGGRAVWLVPASFVAMLVAGAGLGLAGVPLGAVEAGIAASLVVLGLLIACRRKLPLAVGMAIVGTFAVFHGHAHGAEMPQALHPALYALGFVLATVALHAAGVAAAVLARTAPAARLVRTGGVAVAVTGAVLLLA